MKNLKKTLILCLVVVMAISTSGCKKTGEKEFNQGTGEMPEKLTIYSDIGPHALKAGAKDYNDTLYFQLVEKETGCHVEWIHPAQGAGKEKFNLLIASGELPDVISYRWRDLSDGPKMYADDGIIIPLKDLIEENMPNLSAFMKENPDIAKQFTHESGEIYYIPLIKGDKELNIYQGPQIRQDWLEKLGLEVPKTPEDLYTVLKAFKEQDPNGNGKKDEIPMSGVMFENTSQAIGKLLWMFGTTYDFYVEDGKVKYGVMEDSFEEGLRYITKLYKEGLIDTDYLVNDRDKMDAKFMNDKVGFVYMLQPGNYYNNMNDGKRKVLGIDYMAKEGVKNNVFDSSFTDDVSAISLAITTANKNPAGTLKWIDFLYGEKGVEIMNYGEEGVTYEIVDGKYEFTDYIFNNPNGKSQQEMMGLNLGTYQANFPTIHRWDAYNLTLTPWGIESIENWKKSANCDGAIPSTLNFTDEEMEIITRNMSQIETYVSEQINKIVIGKEDIKTLSKVRKEIKKMGIEECIKIYDAALKRYNSK